MSIAPVGATNPGGAQGVSATANTNATPPAGASDSAKTSVSVNGNNYDYLDLSPQGRAALAQIGRGILTSSPDSTGLEGALAAIMKHYDGLFSPKAVEKTDDAENSTNSESKDIRDKVAAFLKEGIEKFGQNTSQSFESLLATKQSRIADTFLSAYRKEFDENGMDAALKAAREAVAGMK